MKTPVEYLISFIRLDLICLDFIDIQFGHVPRSLFGNFIFDITELIFQYFCDACVVFMHYKMLGVLPNFQKRALLI